jgi:thiol-disulfide isomerase/thioredoxin
MQKKVFWIGIVIALLIIAAMAYLLATDDTKTAKQDMISRNDSADQAARQSPPASETAGVYIDFEEGIIERTEGTKLLFFHAPWCPQCRMLDADIKAKGVPADVTIIKVDYDTSQSLRQKYGVTLQTTIVHVDDQGELVKKFVAYDDPSLAAVVENVL